MRDIAPGNKHHPLETLTQCAEWPQFSFQFGNPAQNKEIIFSVLQNFSPPPRLWETSSYLKRHFRMLSHCTEWLSVKFIFPVCLILWPWTFVKNALHTDIIFEFELSQPINSWLITIFTADTLRHAVILTSDLLTLNVCRVSAVTWPNSAPNLSEIEQSAAEL